MTKPTPTTWARTIREMTAAGTLLGAINTEIGDGK
jgi:hypothetical protein